MSENALSKKDAKKKAFASSKQFPVFKLDSVTSLTETTRVLRFKFPENIENFDLPVSSSVLFWTPHEKKPGVPLFRKYTPLDIDDKEYMDYIVKIYPDGRATSWLFNLKIGDEVKLWPHANKHKYVPGNPLIMIAGGTGIAPMIQILKKIVSNPEDTTKVVLLFGAITEESLFYRSWLDEIHEQRKEQFTFHYSVENPSESWEGHKGYYLKIVVEKLVLIYVYIGI